MNFSSNVNKVIRAVLKYLFIFFTKRFCMHQKHKKHNKHKKHQNHKDTTKQKHKHYNWTKIKNALKNVLGEISHLFAYERFCACDEKKIEKRESPQCKCSKYQCPHNLVNVLTPISTLTELWDNLIKIN